MVLESWKTVAQHLERLYTEGSSTGSSDDQLLSTYTGARGESELAFEAIVRRHGPMVLEVCRRALRDRHAAEDAFQATFLVLARRAKSIVVRPGGSLGPWLYGVACRTAREARRNTARRQARERRGAQKVSEAVSVARPDSMDDEERRVLHEEVARLPEKYRSAVVLCYFEGLTHDQAAETLHWPVGTVRGYLARARASLRGRLIRRGVAPAAAAKLLAAERASAMAPLTPSLVHTVARAAIDGSTTTKVLAQAVAICRRLTLMRAGRTAIILLIVGMGSGGVGLVASLSSGASGHQDNSGELSDRPTLEPRPQRIAAKRLDLNGDPLPDGAVARLGTIRFNHGSSLLSVVFTPDGQSLLTLGNDNILRQWDCLTGSERELGGGREILAWRYSLSQDGKYLTTFEGATVVRRLVATGGELSRWVPPSLRASMDLRSMVVSPDGRTVAAGGISQKGECTLWDLQKIGGGRLLGTTEPSIKCVAFSPDGELIATAGPAEAAAIIHDHAHGSVHIWNVREGTEVRHFLVHSDQLNCISFSPEGRTLGAGFTDGTVRIYDPAVGKELSCLDAQGHAQVCLAFSPDGRTLASGSKSTSDREFDAVPIHLWDLATYKGIRQFPAHEQVVSGLAFSPDGKTLASAGADVVVRLWEVATGRPINPSHTNRSQFACVVTSRTDRSLITGGHDGIIRQWDPATGRERNPLGSHSQSVENMAISHDGRSLAVVYADGMIELRDAVSGNELRRLMNRSPAPWCLAGLTFSSSGRTVCAGGKVWDVATGREIATLRDARGRDFQTWAAHSVAFTPDGQDIVATDQSRVCVFDAATGLEIRRIAENELFNAIALSPDGRFLALLVATGHCVRIVHLGSGRQVAEPLALGDTGWALAFSPDGRLLAAGSGDVGWNADGPVRVWELASGRMICHFQGHRAEISSIAFLPDSSRIVSAGADAIAMVWEIATIEQTVISSVGRRDVEFWWENLAGSDAAKANRTISALVAAPDRVVAFLADRLRPVQSDDPAKDTSLGPIAHGETLRRLRAIAVLEKIATPEARVLLEHLASGLEGARETRDARAALRRRGSRP
jgi:RNA polymerase sigma factor (sigma-70 family)